MAEEEAAVAVEEAAVGAEVEEEEPASSEQPGQWTLQPVSAR